MKKPHLLLIFLLALTIISQAQNRSIARGAEPEELYVYTEWYGIYNPLWGSFDTLRLAVCRLTENGKKLTIQCDFDAVTEPLSAVILADATSGVLYNKRVHLKNDGYTYTQLWASFDYGENWVFREENKGSKGYTSGFPDSVIYTTGENRTLLQSRNSGESFEFYFEIPIPYSSGLPGFKECEFFGLGGNSSNFEVHYTNDCANSFTVIPIYNQFITDLAPYPDIYRGSLSGELYISATFLDPENNNKRIYKASFSADTGHSFRHVYVSESYYPWDNGRPSFMSDREPGVFYIIRGYLVEDTNPLGEHIKLCIEYYRDYGETHVATYCHDLTKNYGTSCEAVSDLVSEKCNNDCILLTWSEPESSLPVEGYHIFRNSILLTEELITDTVFFDKDLPVGDYEYYVVAYYTNGCISDTSNHVAETIELGIEELRITNYELRVYPNPTNGELRIRNYELGIMEVEVFDVYGRKVSFLTSHSSPLISINISHLHSGIYFIRIETEKGTITKKIIKY
ncbi:MAG: T9SS type A sorting domain-containing protein [Lentimicrobiaceae bacterium]|nr:T9SS type A sorting domain-containing protein [Lentimicrobiaceae bacterium]